MRNRHQLIITIPITAAIVLMASISAARTFDLPRGKWWEIPRLVEFIKLTAEQQQRIEDLVYQHAQRMIDLNAGVERTKLDLERQVDRNEIDPEAVRKAFGAFQQARLLLENERFEMLLAVRQILSPEQWQRLAGLRERIDERRMRRPGDRGAPLGRRPPGAAPERDFIPGGTD